MPYKDPEMRREYARLREKKRRAANPDYGRDYARRRREADPEAHRERSRKWRAANPEKLREMNRRWGAANPDKRRDGKLRRFGISADHYDKMFKEREGLCDCCALPETVTDKRTGKIRRLNVDHDHDTNIVRGLLCTRCNRGLGLFGDSIPRLIAAVDYLEHTTRGEE